MTTFAVSQPWNSPNMSDRAVFDLERHQKIDINGAYEDFRRNHSWGDENLIDDVILGVNYDMNIEELGRIGVIGEYNKITEIVESPQEKEHDVYLIHRRDAFTMAELASLHSKASHDAYLMGDNFSAHVFSLIAMKESHAAELLHAKAAKEILIVKNRNNDMWKLDLHGLHAMEAVQALEAHLKMIESQVSTSARQRRRSLLVITGRGSHSRGQPVLPTVIRNFLSENGYDHDDSRPGAITVRPKFNPIASECLPVEYLQEWNYFPLLQLHRYMGDTSCVLV